MALPFQDIHHQTMHPEDRLLELDKERYASLHVTEIPLFPKTESWERHTSTPTATKETFASTTATPRH
jgi:hypothetical protein